ncbi:MAG: two-component regulator propeller domain-containing protein [Candidatus Cryptobacteroides sp.]
MKHTALTLMTFIISSVIGHAAEAGYSSYTVTVKDGLSNSSVNSILQDTKGLVWLSTWDGINVYNGSYVKIYKNNPNDENSLLDNIVRSMVQEDERYFWAVTDWGLSRLDTYTDKFTRYRLGFEKSNPFSGSSVSMTIDSEGRIFCSSRGWGVASYDRQTDRMVPFNISDFNTSAVSSIVSAGGRSLILQTVGGQSVRVNYDVDSGGNILAAFSEELLPESTGQYAVSSDSLDIYLIGREYIYRYNKASGSLTDSVAFSGTVSYASMSPEGKLYVVSDRSDLFCVNFDDHSATAVPQMHRDNLLSFCFGTQGIIWLAVDGVGLEACSSVTSALKKIDSRELAGKSGGAVTAMEQVTGGNIYVSILGGGLYVLDSGGNVKGQARGCIPNDYIFSMIEAPGDNLFIGVRNAVVLYRPSDGSTLTLKRFESTPPIVVYCMYYDSCRDNLWIGTLDSGVFCLELEESRGQFSVTSVRRFCHDRNDDASLSSDNVMHIAPCGADCLWVGTLGGGLNLLDVNTGKCTHFLACGAPGDLPNDNARFAMEDAPGSVWVGTSYGLAHGIEQSPGCWTFSSFNEKDGLADNTVHSILKDRSGRIWLGTNRGLSVFDPSDGSFTNQDNAGNLQGWEFYVHSCMMTTDGEMYFGGVNGLNHFFPDEVRSRDFQPDMMIDYLSVRLDNPRIVNDGAPVILKHNENFFNIGFTAIEYINNANCEYAYRLEGFGNDWVTVPAGIPATFTNVPPGRYVFKVRSTNGDKAWCDNEKSLDIVIKRPWYHTGWAYLLYLLTAIFASALLRRYQEERRLQKAMLAKEALEKEKQKETYEAKLTFFTNIAHEFGTPLTLISCSGERLAENIQPQQKSNRYVRIINDNASRMQKLIQELLEFRKVDTGHYEPVYKRIDVSAMLLEMLEDFTGIGEEHNISLNLSTPQEPFILVSDEGALEKILINLISNAYKYTPDGGTVDIVLEKSSDGWMHFTVTNTSKGLSREKLSRVFDRFVILDNLEQQMAKGKKVRNGVGMALVNSYVNTLGGEISVDSVMDKSVTFELRLPSAEVTVAAEGGGSLAA